MNAQHNLIELSNHNQFPFVAMMRGIPNNHKRIDHLVIVQGRIACEQNYFRVTLGNQSLVANDSMLYIEE